MSNIVLFNGEFLPAEEAKINPLNRGMMYGDGCFETYRSYQSRFLNLEDHFQRLQFSLGYLDIHSPFNAEEFKHVSKKLIRHNNLSDSDAMIRLQVWREGGRGYSTESKKPNWIMTGSEVHGEEQAIKLLTASVPVIPGSSLSRLGKLSNGINYIRAAREAIKGGVDDVLMLTITGKVSETTISNVFWVTGNQLFTPSKTCDLLPGITRSVILEIMDVTEGEYEPGEVYNADAIFCTNSIHEIIPVDEFNGKKFNSSHPVILKVKQEFEAYKSEHLS